MAAFPTNMDDHLFSFNSRTIKPANRQVSSAGYTMSFSRGSLSKKAFDFTLSNLNNTDRETLETFIDDNQGVSFTINFTCTGDSTTYNVVFEQDEFLFKRDRTFSETDGTYTIEIKVREV